MTSKAGHTFTAGPVYAEIIGSPRVMATDEKGSWPICDIRGWGHLTGKGSGALGLPHDEAAAIQDAHAHFIAEAFTVLRETGLTPRQLAEQINVVEVQRGLAETQRDELLAAVSSLDIPWLDHNVLSDELVVPIAVLGTSFKAEITIGQLRAICAAIAKATAGNLTDDEIVELTSREAALGPDGGSE